MASVKAYFLLPLKDNEGGSLRWAIRKLVHEVYCRFDGWSKEGVVEGAFRMLDGRMALDKSERYMVFLDEGRLSELEVLLRDFKSDARQEKLYLEVQHDVDIRLI